jgi:voltage-gated potassium channel Kch
LIETFKASFAGLGMFMLTLSVCVLIYSSALYYAEQHVPESSIRSIPDAFWWAIITMTTVGYGDAVPVGWIGRVIGTACAVSGILTLAIPVPIIAGHFNRFYAGMTGRHHHIM